MNNNDNEKTFIDLDTEVSAIAAPSTKPMWLAWKGLVAFMTLICVFYTLTESRGTEEMLLGLACMLVGALEVRFRLVRQFFMLLKK